MFSLLGLDAKSSRSLQLCMVYGFTSMTISLTYKTVLSSYKYDAKFLMLSEQLLVSLLFCAFARKMLYNVPGLEVPEVKLDTLKASIIPGAFFVANIVVGWFGLQMVSIPLFLCLRRTTTAFTLLLEFLILGRRQSLSVNASVMVIVAGAVVTGWQSYTRDYLGFGYILVNNLLTAASMNFQKRFSDVHGVKGFGLVQYNALVALPICLLGATYNHEWEYTSEFSGRHEGGFWTAMASASILGLCMTYITFLCTTVNSPLATSVTGNAKDVVATVVAALIFRDFSPTWTSVGGIVLSFIGAGWFSYAKLVESVNARKALQSDEAETPHAAAAADAAVMDGMKKQPQQQQRADSSAGDVGRLSIIMRANKSSGVSSSANGLEPSRAALAGSVSAGLDSAQQLPHTSAWMNTIAPPPQRRESSSVTFARPGTVRFHHPAKASASSHSESAEHEGVGNGEKEAGVHPGPSVNISPKEVGVHPGPNFNFSPEEVGVYPGSSSSSGTNFNFSSASNPLHPSSSNGSSSSSSTTSAATVAALTPSVVAPNFNLMGRSGVTNPNFNLVSGVTDPDSELAALLESGSSSNHRRDAASAAVPGGVSFLFSSVSSTTTDRSSARDDDAAGEKYGDGGLSSRLFSSIFKRATE